MSSKAKTVNHLRREIIEFFHSRVDKFRLQIPCLFGLRTCFWYFNVGCLLVAAWSSCLVDASKGFFCWCGCWEFIGSLGGSKMHLYNWIFFPCSSVTLKGYLFFMSMAASLLNFEFLLFHIQKQVLNFLCQL